MRAILLVISACLFLSTVAFTQDTNNTSSIEAKTKTKQTKPKRIIFRATKEQVIEVQTKLKENGQYAGAPDGKFNKDFRTSIKDFQGENGLKKTGTLNRATLEKFGIELTEKQRSTPINPNSFAGADDDREKKPRKKAFRPTKTQITEAQTKLKANGNFTGQVDGKYSKDMRVAIRDFQTANGLKRKGSLNRATLEKMGISLTEKQLEIPVNPDDLATADSADGDKPKRRIFRANKDQIMLVQAMLKKVGLYNGEETGKLNPATRTAISEWQAQNNVKKTGTLNKATLEAMKIDLTDKQSDF